MDTSRSTAISSSRQSSLGPRFCRKLTFNVDQKMGGRSLRTAFDWLLINDGNQAMIFCVFVNLVLWLLYTLLRVRI